MHAPVALVGSGEFLEAMRPIDASLLAGRPQSAVIVPTAAANDGAERVEYWLSLAAAHFGAMGVQSLPLRVLNRDDANRPELAEIVGGAGLVYLSGGNPGYLADTLRDTAVWRAILATHGRGTALSGCSAGAMALSALAFDVRDSRHRSGTGLSVLPHLAVIPHFDRVDLFAPGLVETVLSATLPGTVVIGIDENTALVGGPERFSVWGRRSVWQLSRDGERTRLGAGDEVVFPLGARTLTAPFSATPSPRTSAGERPQRVGDAAAEDRANEDAH